MTIGLLKLMKPNFEKWCLMPQMYQKRKRYDPMNLHKHSLQLPQAMSQPNPGFRSSKFLPRCSVQTINIIIFRTYVDIAAADGRRRLNYVSCTIIPDFYSCQSVQTIHVAVNRTQINIAINYCGRGFYKTACCVVPYFLTSLSIQTINVSVPRTYINKTISYCRGRLNSHACCKIPYFYVCRGIEAIDISIIAPK